MNQPPLSETAEEALAELWVASEEKGLPALQASEMAGDGREEALAQLVAAGLVQRREGAVSLTDSGKAEAASIIRRERLAERLLRDVIELDEEQATETACRFEHLLRRGIDDRICTLLGHPRSCPHGSPIPPGECCRVRARAAGTVISTLADLSPGQSGVVAYIHGRRRDLIQRMLAMGVIPGAPVALVQAVPSYVFELGRGQQVAVDRETAQDIYVRVDRRQQPVRRRPPPWLPLPVRGLRLRRRGGRG
jgi:DtxR family Mn-dependent transcriptional regulator